MTHPTVNVDDTTANRESIRVVYKDGRRWLLCPECDNFMPVDHSGECSQCGTHFRVEIVW